MKQLFIIISALILNPTACTKKDKSGIEKVEKAPAAVSALTVHPGRERVKLTWKQPSSEEAATKYQVFWNNNTDSLKIAAPSIDSVGVMIPNLAEGNYTFLVHSYNAKGVKSQGVAVSGKVYGSQYELGLVSRPIDYAFFNDAASAVTINWKAALGEVIASELNFTDNSDVQQTILVLKAEVSTVLSAYKPGSDFTYRTLYKPHGAIDTFYTAYDTVTVVESADEDGTYTSMVTLEADGPGNTYELLGSVLGGSPEETPDCRHTDFGRHITEEFNTELNKHVFAFFAHTAFDDDRCGATDRQRTEIKTYSPSPAAVKAFNGDEMIFKWKFKLADGFQPSSSFTHIHQIKAGDGTNAGSPLITITPRYGNPDKLEIIHTGNSGATSLNKVQIVNLEAFKGVWIEAVEKIKFGTHGTYSIVLRKVSDGTELLSYENNDIDLWRSAATFIRPKWGIYRSLNNKERLRDEKVLFADFVIGKK